jgi:predicted dehydrogenase/threonine dehydrogenase-like Zn-dependent dehydrogenase
MRTETSVISAGTEKAVIDLAKKPLLKKARTRPDLVRHVIDNLMAEGVIETTKKVFNKLDNPLALGYSCSGTVVEIGKNVSEFKVGERVACGGAGYASHSDINYVPKNLCAAVPENVSCEEAAFTALGAIAMQGIRRCELSPGERVGVIGLGLLGQLTTRILSAYGFPILGIDIDERKVNRCIETGLDKAAVIGRDNVEESALSFSGGHGLDAVIITASTESNEPVELAGRICRLRGRVIAVGSVGMKIPRDIYYAKELDFRISRSYGPGRYDTNYEEKGIDYPYAYVRWTEKRNMEEFLRLVSSGRVEIKGMVTHEFKLEDYEKAYEIILRNPNKEDYTGILLRYDTAKQHSPVITLDTGRQKREAKGIMNAGVIGCGNFAKGTILPALKRIKNVNIKALASASGRGLDRLGQRYRCQYLTTDYHQILNDPEINAVFIATRHNLHKDILMEALKKGKSVFVEKPLCISEKEFEEIMSFYNSPGSAGSLPLLTVGFNRRFAPQSIKARKRFADRTTPLMINYRIHAGYIPPDHWVHDPKEGGGRIVGEACHFVDLLQFLTGSAPVKVYATQLPQRSLAYRDNVGAVIDFSDGSRGNIFYTSIGGRKIPKEYIEIFGNKTSMAINNFKKGRFSPQDKGHFSTLKNFTESVINGGAAPIPFSEILLSTLTTFKIHRSLETGEPVKIDLSEVEKD